jgi:3-deoxy-7-phosphoheptulonate synthase
MIVVMNHTATDADVAAVAARIESFGARAHHSAGSERTIIGVLGDLRTASGGGARDQLAAMAGVEKVVPIAAPYKLASRALHPADTVIDLGHGVRIGGGHVVAMAGPCSIEGRDHALGLARQLHGMGVRVFRGGAFKPRTSPYSFQGMGEAGLKVLAEISAELGMVTVTEVVSPDEVELVARYADVLQVGTRNMQNYRLLEAIGRCDKPVLLKRGMSATIEELLLAAEYVLAGGNPNVMLCERGIRTFEPSMRGTFDLGAVPLLRQLTHLPVVADPSHATGLRDLVGPVALGAVAAGADGFIVEAHEQPEAALSDAAQTIDLAQLGELLATAAQVAAAVGHTLDVAARGAAAVGGTVGTAGLVA